MNKSNQPSKRHHYVPQFYLRFFLPLNSKELSVLRKDTQESSSIKSLAPKSICFFDNLHTISKTPESEKFYEIEKFYSEIEHQLKKIIDQLQKEKIKDMEENSDIQWILQFFVSLMFWRNPANTKIVKQHILDALEYYNKSSHEQQELINKDRHFIKFLFKKYKKYNNMGKQGVNRLENILKIFQYLFFPIFGFQINRNKKLKLHYSNSLNYISTDNPVITLGDFEETRNFKKIIFPVTPNILIISNDIDINEIENINLIFTKNAKKYIYGDIDILKKLKDSL